MAFTQENFVHQDLYSENSYLRDTLSYFVPGKHFNEIEPDVKRFSARVSSDVLEMSRQAEREEPQWVPFDHWGNRVDDIIMSEGWKSLHVVAAEEGIVATAYERKSEEFSRVHQMMKLLLFHPSSAYFSCPLAMTDGAARVLETADAKQPKELAFSHLTSRRPKEFWTAGQWMTEKIGGSDVSQTETQAELIDGEYFLSGTKWFTSAITAEVALTLAQATDESGQSGLTMFFVKIRNEKGLLNKIEVLRLKDKLGTRAMPTAELELKKCPAIMVGKVGEGVKNISTVLNTSRLYTAVCATGAMYRLMSLSRDYAHKRKAFGKTLADHPLHTTTLFDWQARVNASVQFVVQMSILMGRSETGKANEEDQALLRLMTPVVKLWTGKHCVQIMSELIESFGGAGYIEDTGLPKYLRDNQVLSIWEGTTNILSLDTLRAMSKGDVLELSLKAFAQRIGQLKGFETEKKKMMGFIQLSKEFIQSQGSSKLLMENSARSLAFALGDVFAGLLLCEFAEKTKKKRDQLTAERFIQNIKAPEFVNSEERVNDIREALFS
ncbi:MAG: acyl-CoA dehydrogenase family protein [Bdellovibrionales bacterium]|nr:acyl-CoA dehydrogenase family protein [Bdellovibrionales bacterium]NQZ19261.1 acyl-CoA dehydrogenase family protein [Bdellovibrionales bacterium]